MEGCTPPSSQGVGRELKDGHETLCSRVTQYEEVAVTSSSTMSSSQLFAKLDRNELASRLVLTGLIKRPDSGESYVLFAFGTQCVVWRRIPQAIIEGIEYLTTISCGDHTHPLVKISFKEPQSEEASLFALLLDDMKHETRRIVTTVLGGESRAGVSGSATPACHQCLLSCLAVVNPEDYYACIDYCMKTYCGAH
jgi:hypothetical protein